MEIAEKIKKILEDSNSGLREKLVRSVGTFTTALLAISGSGPDEKLTFRGTGSLVKFQNSHYILTAAHVWDSLKSSKGVGITLKEDLDHCCPLVTNTLVPFGPAKPEKWNEWGPDLVFLRIPANRVGGIAAFKSFYALDKERPRCNVERIEVVILMGTPEEFGKFTEQHAELDITGLFTEIGARTYRHGDYDFIDLNEDVTLPGVPEDFGGVSGGGLWRVQVFENSELGEIDWLNLLEGVAFYQLGKPNHRMIIRCHGDASISSAMSEIPAA
jgi:hypothetical protein